MTQEPMDPAPRIEIERLSGPFGATIRSLDLGEISSSHAEEIRTALAAHGVLHLGAAQPDTLRAIAESLGALVEPAELGEHSVDGQAVTLTNVDETGAVVDDGHPLASAVRRSERWHFAGSFLAAPPTIMVATARVAPTRGGQTQFADMRAALRLLPPDALAAAMDGSLVHGRNGVTTEQSAEHPWVQRLPDGTEALMLGAHVSHIVGMDRSDSRQRLAEIEAQLNVHDVVHEHRWQPGDVVAWDNRFVAHRHLPFDVENEPRTLHLAAIRSG